MRTALLLIAGLAVSHAWAQNTCATALPITAGTYIVDAVNGPQIPFPMCAPNGSNNVTASEWYTYTPAQDTMITITTDLPVNTGDDTRFHVYTGTCASLVCAGGDDDSGTNYLSIASMMVTGGTTYTIAFDNRWNASGFTFMLIESPPPSPGSQCSTAIPVSTGVLYQVDAIVGQLPLPSCFSDLGTASHGAWYSYTATQDTGLTVTTDLPQNSGDDTRVHVYAGGCNNLDCVAQDDASGTDELAITTFNVTAGVTYIIAFDDKGASDGFAFELVEVPPLPVLLSFTPGFTAPGLPYGAVDMNNDHLDDVVSPATSSVDIAYQQEDGTLSVSTIVTPPADFPASWSFCAGDLNADGYNDMMYGAGSGTTFMLSTGTGSGYTEFSPLNYIFCQRTNMVDLNNDGNLDAFSCHDVDANVYFLNDGAGNLNFGQGGLGPTCGNYGSIWVDYDNDGDQDLFVAKCGCDPVDLFLRNDGNMQFNSVAGPYGFEDSHQSWSSAWGDFDNDGDMDGLVGASSSGYHKLMRNDGNGFTNVTAGSGVDAFTGQSIEWVTHDFNNDGYLDILGGYGFLLGHGDMTFTRLDDIPTNGPIGDLNGDGFLDIIQNAQVYYNAGNDNHWLTISTVGTTSNTNGIGARVTITSAMGTQIRDVRSGDGFRYMSTLNTHFGLGADTEVSEVRIDWPSGLTSTLYDVTADQHLVIIEGVTTNVQDDPAGLALELYPSPAENTLFVRNGDRLGNRPVRVMDASGKLVQRSTLRNGTVDVSGLSAGIYLLRIDGGEVFQARFIKH